MRRLAFLALPLALAACNNEADAPDAPAAEETAAAETVEQAPEATLDLQADGLVVPAQNGFEELSVPFGSNRAATEATLANVLGEPVADNQPNDCGLTTTSYEGMALHFRDDSFVGYYANAPYVPELTREEMLADPMVNALDDTTIDGEFTIGDSPETLISGVFVGDEVRALWAGENCIAR